MNSTMSPKLNMKISRRIIGVKHNSLGKIESQKSFDAEDYKKRLAQSGQVQTNQQVIKTLKDRLKVLEQELQKAREESFQAGFEDGKQRGKAESAKEMEALKEQCQIVQEQFEKAILRMEVPVLKLAGKMAEKLIHNELENSAETDTIILENLRNGLQEIVDENKVLVRVNPKHLEMLSNQNLNQEFDMPGNMDINLVGDKNLKPGETVIESDNFIMDGTYSNQLDYLEDQLENEASE